MYAVTVIVHVLVCLFLMGVVLLQSGKGAEMGATFGGSSQTLFGARGAGTFLSKMTIGAAIFFFVTSLSLTLLKKETSIFHESGEILATSTPRTASTSTVPTPDAANRPATSTPSLGIEDLPLGTIPDPDTTPTGTPTG